MPKRIIAKNEIKYNNFFIYRPNFCANSSRYPTIIDFLYLFALLAVGLTRNVLARFMPSKFYQILGEKIGIPAQAL